MNLTDPEIAVLVLTAIFLFFLFLMLWVIYRMERACDYWERRARFFEDRTYENLRLNFRDHTQNPDPADWWKEQP